jgi:hypothetical protein
MNTEERNRQSRPTKPWPHFSPSRQAIGCFQVTIDHSGPMRTVELDLDPPSAWLGKFELGRVKKLVRSRLWCRGILQGRLTGFGHTNDHPRLGQGLSSHGVLNEHTDIYRTCPEGGRRRENGDLITALLF